MDVMWFWRERGFEIRQPFTSCVKSDHCSTRKARMSRTDAGNHGKAFSAIMAAKSLAKSSVALTHKLPAPK